MSTYLHFIDAAAATARNESLALEQGCGPTTLYWFNQLSHTDGRQAFEVVEVDQESLLNQAEQDALTPTLWYQNVLSGDIHVAPDGVQNGDGSVGNPVSLSTACSALSTISPGSTIHIHPGEYVGDFDFIHSGANGNEITISVEVGARIKGSFTISGSHLTCLNLDIFDAPRERWTEETGSSPAIATHEGLSLFGANLTVAHPVVRDCIGNGCGFWQPSIHSVLYGLWTINNGWDAPDRGHGHGLYTQNASAGPKLVRNCLWAQGYSGGLRAYTTNQSLEQIVIDRCTNVNDQIFLGGHSPASLCQITNNRVWNDCLEIGETDRDNVDILVDGNYVVNSPNTRCAVFRFWDNLTITNNTFVLRQDNGMGLMFEYLRLSPSVEVIDNNVYYYQPRADGYYFLLYDYTTNPPTITHLTISQWQALGYDTHSTFIEGLPTANQVFVEHSEYNDDIAHVTIFNWEGLASVDVDVSGGNFTVGATYRAYNAMNPDEYHEFVYTGIMVGIPMTGWTVAAPSGASSPISDQTWPDFMALVIKRVI